MYVGEIEVVEECGCEVVDCKCDDECGVVYLDDWYVV